MVTSSILEIDYIVSSAMSPIVKIGNDLHIKEEKR